MWAVRSNITREIRPDASLIARQAATSSMGFGRQARIFMPLNPAFSSGTAIAACCRTRRATGRGSPSRRR